MNISINRIILIITICILFGCDVGINKDRMIKVFDSSDNLLEHETGEFDFGYTDVNTSISETFTIKSTGLVDLELLDDLTVQLSGANADSFEVTKNPETHLPNGSTTTFIIEFAPTVLQDFEAIVLISNNDKDFNPYTFTLKGSGAVPIMKVKQDTIDIDYETGIYDFGVTLLGKPSQAVSFQIENLGIGNLNLTGSPMIQITGIDSLSFAIDQTNISSPIPTNGSTTFTITFDPINKGPKSAIITIANNDSEKDPYKFTVTGTCRVTEPVFDFNGDGYEDIIVGAYKDDENGETKGSAFIFLGRPDQLPEIDASEADVKIIGNDINDDFGRYVSVAGDYNNDGFDDVIIGAPNDDDSGRDSGCAFLFFGSANPTKELKASDADVLIVGLNTFDYFGTSVNNVGDFNNDGFDDVIIGASGNDDGGSNSGCAYLFLGCSNPNPILSTYNADTKIIGQDRQDNFGISASGAGDVNGDGFDDVIVGASGDDDGGIDSGCAFIFFGKSNMNKVVDASRADMKIVGKSISDHFGYYVSNAGDFNGDGFDDVIVSAIRSTDCSTYIFFGSNNMSSVISASNANVTLYGQSLTDYFGISLSNAGDVNGDGFDDILVGAIRNDEGGTDSGAAYIFLGSSNPDTYLYANDAQTILIGDIAYDSFGISVSYCGDMNADGYDDVIIGASGNDDGGLSSGCAYIFLGVKDWSYKINASKADTILIGDDAGDYFGSAVSGGN